MMNQYCYLTYIIDPFSHEIPPRLHLRRAGGDVQQVTTEELATISQPIVGYHLDDLASFHAGGASALALDMIDITHAARLLVGKQHYGRRSGEPWRIWNLLKQSCGDSEAVTGLWRYMYEGVRDVEPARLNKWVSDMSQMLEVAWMHIREQLEAKGEAGRYYEVEKPVNELFLQRQLAGIAVDRTVLFQRLDAIDRELGLAGKALRDRWRIGDPFDSEEVRKALAAQGFAHLADVSDDLFESYLDLHAEHAELPIHLKWYRNRKRDKTILLRLGGIGGDRIHPYYKTIGTVTGRITVEAPLLQNLKSTHRDVIAADAGKALLYPDYSQFEPGILADDSHDPELTQGFNSGDLYKALSSALFGGDSQRESAKLLFLSFCYGMKIKRMIRLVAEATGQKVATVEPALASFFGKYRRLTEWTEDLRSTLLGEGRIGTRLGNFRYRDHDSEKLSNQEERWALSQRIQGTASLILKRVIIDLSRTCPLVEILLPMHDALLLQVPENELEATKRQVRDVFVNTLRNECPSIQPRVTFDSFAR